VAVGLQQPDNLYPVGGVKLTAVASGIKSNGSNDLALIVFDEGASCAATFTQNAFCAAPVTIAKKHLTLSSPRALIINSGNANAGTGQRGLDDAVTTCKWVSEKIDCKPEEVLPFSTGVIGEYLPMQKIKSGIEVASSNLSAEQWMLVATGIMTTDTIAKAVSRRIMINDETVTITGIAKGSGMICPDMATMLAFVTTDANVDQDYLQQCLAKAVNKSFNSITVDGDTSTNDACVLVATGASSQHKLDGQDESSHVFANELEEVCLHLAQSIIRDGEGATKFVAISVTGASSDVEAHDVAYTVAQSPLVKTALFASDPNWGRILAAVGRAGIDNLVLEDVTIFLDDVCIVSKGGRDDDYTEEKGQAVMDQAEINIHINLSRGHYSRIIWTTDLSDEYVRINAEYRT